MSTRFLFDTHCHFFSAQHIPLTQTLQRVHKQLVGTFFKRAKLTAGVSAVSAAVGPLLPIATMLALEKLDDKLGDATDFIRFFDQDAYRNIFEAILSIRQMQETALPVTIQDRVVVFTPLVMDFEECSYYQDRGGNTYTTKPLRDQVEDLKANIKRIERDLKRQKCLVLPFLGLDLRRFYACQPGDVANRLDEIISELGVTIKQHDETSLLAEDANGNYKANGDFVGIKLYPSLGYDLKPDSPDHYAIHQNLIKALADRGYPVTVHCQFDSYECGRTGLDNKTLDEYAHPDKWLELIEASGASNIRLNLAHFGGEDGVKRMVEWGPPGPSGDDEYEDYEFQGIVNVKRSEYDWSWSIIEMLKKYDFVYSDLGAFDFADEQATASLLWLLHEDEAGGLPQQGAYKLKDKLMWGSDIPMTLFDKKSYAHQFREFLTAMTITGYSTDYDLPPTAAGSELGTRALIDKLIEHNPRSFLSLN